MAIHHGTATVTVETTDRTWRTNIETAEGADPVLTFHREVVKKEGNAVVGREANAVVTRNLSQIADQEFEVGNSWVPVSEIFATLIVMADTFRQEDIDAAAVATPTKAATKT
jgi:hypothetical protein